ncbi:MAG: hypothetical protein D6761_07095 [Candidatus Dadabacteria bacterium]|nr:MAG: hypothetical protein D6761_07095 [Candidatus Dadabacteria bacterium]
MIRWLLLVAILLAPGLVRAGEWVDASGVAASRGDRDLALYQAQRQALSRALAGYLQQWVAVEEMEQRSATMQRWFFSSPRAYVQAISDPETRQRGYRMYWSGKVRFDDERIVGKLVELGFINSWDRDPRLYVRTPDGRAAAWVTHEAWATRLFDAGILFVFDPAVDVDGILTVTIETQQQPHPVLQDRVIALTDAVVDVQIGDVARRIVVPVGPADRMALQTPAMLSLLDTIFSAWTPLYEARAEAQRWRAGPFAFTDVTAWQAMDQAFLANRGVFHGVYPSMIERHGSRWKVTWTFTLNSSDIDGATRWFAERGYRVRDEGDGRFAPAD